MINSCKVKISCPLKDAKQDLELSYLFDECGHKRYLPHTSCDSMSDSDVCQNCIQSLNQYLETNPEKEFSNGDFLF